MGVKDLWNILSPICEKKPIWELQDKTIAIDLSAWICDSSTVAEFSSQKNMYLRNLFFRTSFLLLLGVRPIFVLEGKAPELKQNTMEKRQQARGHVGTSKSGNRTRLKGLQNQCAKMLEAMGLKCIQGDGEAEAFCALLNQAGIVDGIITQDSDVFLYGGITVYRHFTTTGPGGGSVDTITMQEIETKLDLGRNKLIVLSLLTGCDYTKGVSGVGKESALKFFNSVTDDEILNRIKTWRSKRELDTINVKDKSISPELKAELLIRQKALVDTDFPSVEILNEFLQNDEKTCPQVDFQWNKPNLGNFMKLADVKLAWDSKYALEKFLPLLTRWHLTKNDTSLIPLNIIKCKTTRGIKGYVMQWQDFDINTEEPQTLVELRYPYLVDSYMEEKSKGKTSKKNKENENTQKSSQDEIKENNDSVSINKKHALNEIKQSNSNIGKDLSDNDDEHHVGKKSRNENKRYVEKKTNIEQFKIQSEKTNSHIEEIVLPKKIKNIQNEQESKTKSTKVINTSDGSSKTKSKSTKLVKPSGSSKTKTDVLKTKKDIKSKRKATKNIYNFDETLIFLNDSLGSISISDSPSIQRVKHIKNNGTHSTCTYNTLDESLIILNDSLNSISISDEITNIGSTNSQNCLINMDLNKTTSPNSSMNMVLNQTYNNEIEYGDNEYLENKIERRKQNGRNEDTSNEFINDDSNILQDEIRNFSFNKSLHLMSQNSNTNKFISQTQCISNKQPFTTTSHASKINTKLTTEFHSNKTNTKKQLTLDMFFNPVRTKEKTEVLNTSNIENYEFGSNEYISHNQLLNMSVDCADKDKTTSNNVEANDGIASSVVNMSVDLELDISDNEYDVSSEQFKSLNNLNDLESDVSHEGLFLNHNKLNEISDLQNETIYMKTPEVINKNSFIKSEQSTSSGLSRSLFVSSPLKKDRKSKSLVQSKISIGGEHFDLSDFECDDNEDGYLSDIIDDIISQS